MNKKNFSKWTLVIGAVVGGLTSCGLDISGRWIDLMWPGHS